MLYWYVNLLDCNINHVHRQKHDKDHSILFKEI